MGEEPRGDGDGGLSLFGFSLAGGTAMIQTSFCIEVAVFRAQSEGSRKTISWAASGIHSKENEASEVP
jgi:hypothetical protein